MKNLEATLVRNCATPLSPRRPAAGRYRQGAMLLAVILLIAGCGPPDRDKAVKEIKNLGCTASATDVRLTVVAGDTIDDKKFAELSKFATLQDSKKKDYFESVSLDLSKSQVTADGLATLKQMPNVTMLFLTGVPATDDSLANLVPLKNLTDLALEGTKITDAGLKHLEVLTALESLTVPDTISDEAIDALVAKIPALKDNVEKVASTP